MCKKLMFISLLRIIVLIVVGADSEVSQLVRVLLVGHNTDPITQTVLLQVLLGQVLEVGLGEVHIGADVQLHLRSLKGDIVAQVVYLSVNLKASLHVFLLWSVWKSRHRLEREVSHMCVRVRFTIGMLMNIYIISVSFFVKAKSQPMFRQRAQIKKSDQFFNMPLSTLPSERRA